MNRLWYHISRWGLVIIPVLLVAASATAQLAVSQGQVIDLTVDQEPGVTYTWELYSDSTIDFVAEPGDVTADLAEFVNGIKQGSKVQVIWHVPGVYYYKVTAVDELACTNNIKMGLISIQEVSNEIIPPVAIDDEYTVDCEEQFFFVTDNDENEGNYDYFVSILEWPTQGILQELDDQGTVSYTINMLAQGTDSFTYTLCLDMEQTLCDTATVHITIPDHLNCNPAESPAAPPDTTCHFFIPEGFSPNGDGAHDYFVIDCIEQYPNAKLMIFDKQGYLLYGKENYGNTNIWGYSEADLWWGGQTTKHHHNADQMVIPGVYLYVLDKGNGDLARGFVMVSYGRGN
ncbi:T9SS type B sorting domain-containing protein [Mangrovibacterium lignilyticum]|uniref:T9SS type B sorting domain-containing protein n=1 Tax=Mangrovibacterium lignilyticum TaxID=2668052 RepID=UPI0013D4B069|nr:gliding motility-associated C-terminal domain-containing protein [Mangrovibacterium lignilyticum]